jgi:hypothetical protein
MPIYVPHDADGDGKDERSQRSATQQARTPGESWAHQLVEGRIGRPQRLAVDLAAAVVVLHAARALSWCHRAPSLLALAARLQLFAASIADKAKGTQVESQEQLPTHGKSASRWASHGLDGPAIVLHSVSVLTPAAPILLRIAIWISIVGLILQGLALVGSVLFVVIGIIAAAISSGAGHL